jgi:hypothetical protein
MLMPTVATGTLGALNNAVTIDMRSEDSANFEIQSGLSGTVTFEASHDGTNWYPISLIAINTSNTTTGATTTTSSGIYCLESTRGAVVTFVRARVSAYTSGSAVCKGRIGITGRP